MKLFFRTILEIIFGLWLGIYGVILFLYVLFLVEKLNHPNIKNMSWNEAYVFGSVLFGLLIINIFIIIKAIKKAQPSD